MQGTPRSAVAIDREAIEPRLLDLLYRKHERRKLGAYQPRTAEEIGAGLERLLASEGVTARATDVRRMGGGASKEQFLFEIALADGTRRRCVLRMDPREGILETCRWREAEVLRAVAGVVPVPPVLWVDGDGEKMGQPVMITGFVPGVTKPTRGAEGGPSGLGVRLGDRIANAIGPQFIDYLVAIHGVALATAGLDHYALPRPGTTDAALWQVNYWTKVRALDATDASPLLTLAETWLYDNLPVCEAPVLLHGDYRLGNFLFDEDALQITAWLDWELAHVGDFHEDLAYSFDPLFGQKDETGQLIVGTMFSTAHLIDRYQALSGRRVDPQTLHWYRVLTSYKLVSMNHTSSILAARDGTNHQNALLAYLASCTAGLSQTLCGLLEECLP